jgi:hypothetical protein
MSSQSVSQTGTPTTGAHATMPLRLDAWINEPLPDVRAILCSRDVARLTRRPSWLLHSLAWLGKFPRRRCYRGRRIGWHREDVLTWLTRDLVLEPPARPTSHGCATRRPKQACLPLDGHLSAALVPSAAERCSRSVRQPAATAGT